MAKHPFGVLIVHGFTSSLDCVNGLVPPVEALGLPYRMPILRGHGQDTPEALRGTTWHDWVSDAEDALRDLMTEVDQVIVCGLSMGALVALTLATRHRADIDSIVAISPGIKTASPMGPGRPLAFLKPVVSRLCTKWGFPPVYADPELSQHDTNYDWAPIDAVSSLLDLTKEVRDILPQVEQPILILHSRKDTLAHPDSAEILYQEVSTPDDEKLIVWFKVTNHEMLRDCEREEAIDTVADYIQERIGQRVKAE